MLIHGKNPLLYLDSILKASDFCPGIANPIENYYLWEMETRETKTGRSHLILTFWMTHCRSGVNRYDKAQYVQSNGRHKDKTHLSGFESSLFTWPHQITGFLCCGPMGLELRFLCKFFLTFYLRLLFFQKQQHSEKNVEERAGKLGTWFVSIMY